MNYKDCFLIVENSTTPLKQIENVSESQVIGSTGQQSNSKTSSYILEGMFTNLNGAKNKNGRIYEKEMFMPFYEKCKLKAETGSFIGECDHPKRFETQFKTASHVIESIWYDEVNQAIMGRIRILNGHPVGEMVKSLIDNGITINVSSRSAGQIDASGKVQLKEVFTWDLVTVPGFDGTNMRSVKESLEEKGLDSSILESHIPGSGGYINLSQDFGLPNTVEIYDIGGISNINENINEYNNLPMNNSDNDDNLTSKDLKKMLAYVNENFKSLDRKISNSTQNLTEPSSDMSQELQLEYVKKYLSLMSDKVNDFFEHHEYTTDMLQKVVEYQDYQSEVLEKVANFSDYVGNNVQNVAEYSNYLSEKLTENNRYTDYLGERLGDTNGYSGYIGDIVKKLSEHSDYLSEHLNNSIGYTEISNIQTSKELDKVKDYTNYLAEGIQDVAYIRGNTTLGSKEANNSQQMSLVESLVGDINEDIDLSSKIDLLIKSVGKVNQESKVRNNFDFVTSLPLDKRKEFNLLSEEKKQKLSGAVKASVRPLLEYEILDLWEDILVDENDEPDWLRLASNKYRKIWESLDENLKEAIAIQANSRNLNSMEEIENFWITRAFNQGKRALSESQNDYSLAKLLNSKSDKEKQLDESKTTTKSQNLYGISDDDLDRELGLITN